MTGTFLSQFDRKMTFTHETNANFLFTYFFKYRNMS